MKVDNKCRVTSKILPAWASDLKWFDRWKSATSSFAFEPKDHRRHWVAKTHETRLFT